MKQALHKYSNKETKEYLEKLPQKRIAACVLIFNENQELLIIKNSYRDFWTIPGGVVEKFESPWAGAEREAKEEVGLDVKIDRLTAIDYVSSFKGEKKDYHDEALIMIFLSKKLTKKEISKLRIDNDEVVDYKFVKIKDLKKHLNEKWMQRIGNFKNKGVALLNSER